MASRALILQQKTHRPVQFEITEPTRNAVSAWINKSALNSEDFLFPSRIRESPHLSRFDTFSQFFHGFQCRLEVSRLHGRSDSVCPLRLSLIQFLNRVSALCCEAYEFSSGVFWIGGEVNDSCFLKDIG